MTDTRYDHDGNFVGMEPRECGEHRTVGPHRAWCFECGEWCYPESPCVRCEVVELRAEIAQLREGRDE
jgi:hypothetical protein